jgi:hypothetical protein
MALETNLSAEDQASLDAMRAADSQPDPQAGQQPEPSATEPDGDALPGAAAGEDADKDKPAQQKMVPHAALHEEREMRKAAERAREEERQRWEQRFEQLLQRVPQPQPQPAAATAPEIPAFDADPVGNIVGTQRAQGATQAQIVQALQNYAAEQQHQQAIGQLQHWAIGQENAFVRENPAYSEATDFLKNNRRDELRAFGAGEGDIERQLEKDRLEIAVIAHQRNLRFPEVIMQMARTRGFAPKAAAAAADTAAAQPNAADKLASVAAGQQQSRSLGDARGTAPAPMTAARLLAMNDADFDKALKDPATRGLLGA